MSDGRRDIREATLTTTTACSNTGDGGKCVAVKGTLLWALTPRCMDTFRRFGAHTTPYLGPKVHANKSECVEWVRLVSAPLVSARLGSARLGSAPLVSSRLGSVQLMHPLVHCLAYWPRVELCLAFQMLLCFDWCIARPSIGSSGLSIIHRATSFQRPEHQTLRSRNRS
jgi:hypothetical protein